MNLTKRSEGDVQVISLGVECLDADNSKEFRAEVAKLVHTEDRVVLDLETLQFIDSSGLGSILSCLRELHSIGGDLKLCGMSTAVRAMFELVRMHRIIEIYDDDAQAVASF